MTKHEQSLNEQSFPVDDKEIISMPLKRGAACFLQIGFLCLVLALPSAAQGASDKPPDLDSIATAGRASLKRLERQAAAWTATTRLPGDNRVVVEKLVTPTMRRSVLTIETKKQRSEALRIIERGGYWYATEGRKTERYRPYKAPFDLPTTYFFLIRSEPQFITQSRGNELGVLEGTKSGIATYRTPLPEPLRQQVLKTLSGMNELRRQYPEQGAKPEVTQAIEQMQELITKGTPLKIEIASGMVVQLGSAEKQTEFHGFTWLDQVPPKKFEVEGRAWEDNTEDPTKGDLSELLMLSHSGVWRPGMKAGDTDGRLLDLHSGRYRRIPFQGAIALPGCFLKDRTRIVVSGLDVLSGVLGLYEVDLKTGQNRRLGGELLASGFSLMPALSPDGKRLAVLHKGAREAILESQVCLVDLKNGEATAMGEPRDVAYLSWFPDGKSLLLVNREVVRPADMTAPRTDTIARLELSGRLTKIREGSSPVLLNDGRTILFQDTTSRKWQTCDLDGGNLKTYAGGLAGYGFPSPAPAGKRIIMMRFRPDNAPEPIILPLGESAGERAVNAPGLWATPAWR